MLGNGVILLYYILPVIALTQIPKKYPEAYAKSKFAPSPGGLKIVAVLAIFFLAIQAYFLLSDLPPMALGVVVGYILCAYLYCHFAWKKGDINFTKEF